MDEYVGCGDVVGVGSGDGEVVGGVPLIGRYRVCDGKLGTVVGRDLVAGGEVVCADEGPFGFDSARGDVPLEFPE